MSPQLVRHRAEQQLADVTQFKGYLAILRPQSQGNYGIEQNGWVGRRMHKYRKKVKLAAAIKSGELIYNGSIDHAEILARELIHTAQDEVCILSHELDSRVYGKAGVVEQVKLFIAKPERKMRILVERSSIEDRKDHPLYETFFDNKRQNIEFRIVPEGVQETYDFNMIVADGESYRYESDRNVPVAIASFGDTAGAQNLYGLFETLWNESEEIAAQ